jgi:hypothetical protein
MALVSACAKNNISGRAANHVKMKPKGSGSCTIQEDGKVNNGEWQPQASNDEIMHILIKLARFLRSIFSEENIVNVSRPGKVTETIYI